MSAKYGEKSVYILRGGDCGCAHPVNASGSSVGVSASAQCRVYVGGCIKVYKRGPEGRLGSIDVGTGGFYQETGRALSVFGYECGCGCSCMGMNGR